MGFESKRDKILSSMEATKETKETKEKEVTDNVVKKAEAAKKVAGHEVAPRKVAPRIPSIKNEEDVELTRNYTFSLQPSRRRRLDEVARMSGYRSTSKFLNDLISKM